MALVLDTGPVLALLDRDDAHHDETLTLIGSTEERLVLVAPTLVEIDYWVRKRLDLGVLRVFVDDIRDGAYDLEELEPTDLARAVELEAKYSDLELGMVDAAVIAVCERLGEKKVATFDHRHFGVVQPRHCERLLVLP